MAKILNNILCTAMVFLLSFAWTIYCTRDAQLALILSAVVAAASCYIIFAILSKLETKRKISKKRKSDLQCFATFLQFNADNSALFMSMFCYYNIQTEQLDFDNIILTKNGRNLASFCFQNTHLTMQKLQEIIVKAKRNNCQKLTVFCNKFDNSLLSIANSQIPAVFVDIDNTYALFEQAEKLPVFSKEKPKKQRFLPQYAFNRKRFCWYFFGAVFTLLTSFVSLIKIYLLVWATVLFCLSMFCLFNTKYNKKPTNISPQMLL